MQSRGKCNNISLVVAALHKSNEAPFSGSTASVAVSGTTVFVCAIATEYTNLVYLLCDRNGSDCECNDSVELVRDHNGSLCTMAIEYNDSFHLF